MFPWLWIWSPQLNFPLSGNVAQDIEPQTRFFDYISPSAGDGSIERRAFDVASYGRQLGLITDVLLELADREPPLSGETRVAADRLRDIRAAIECIKVEESESASERIAEQVEALRRQDPDGFLAIRARLLPLLEASGI